ncbi:unnamed protein product, partial [Didymodactylos carnosus]
CNTNELLHTIVALYDSTLPDIGAETIYNTICDKKVVTILVVIENNNSPKITPQRESEDDQVINKEDCLDKLVEDINYPDSVFKNVFSDSESSSSSEEDVDDGNSATDYSTGIGKFLEKVKSCSINIQQKLVACVTFQKVTTFQQPCQEEHVIDLQLMACRKKYRNNGIGRYLVKLLMDRDYIGEYDAIVTAADQKAIDFYRKFGFTEDAILTSKY